MLAVVSLLLFVRGYNLTTGIGSTTVYPHGDSRLRPQELGASIFVDSNRNLVKAVEVGQPL